MRGKLPGLNRRFRKVPNMVFKELGMEEPDARQEPGSDVAFTVPAVSSRPQGPRHAIRVDGNSAAFLDASMYGGRP
jgi:hypothetical protein